MYTLFGNDLAVQYARKNSQHDYPAGSVLSLVAWNQQRTFVGLEEIYRQHRSPWNLSQWESPPDHRPLYSYQGFEGAPLKKVSTQESPTLEGRAAYLLSQRAAVMP